MACPVTGGRGVERQRGALGHRQLQRDQVQAGDQLGHRVLDLQPGVHLQERGRPAGGDEELDRAGADVADGPGGRDRGLVQLAAEAGGQGGRCLLDDLLVPPLHRAVPLAQRQDGPVGVREDLHLDVPGRRQPALHEHGPVPERRGRLPPGGLDRTVQLGRCRDHPHAPTAAAVGRLDQQRVTGVGRDRVRRPGRQDRHAGRGHPLLGVHFGPHRRDRLRRWPDPDQPGRQHGPGEPGVLGQEPVPRVDRVRAGAHGRVHQQVGPQVGLGRGRPGQLHREVGLADPGPTGVHSGMHRHRRDAQRPAGPDDPARDLTPVGDQQTPDLCALLGQSTRRKRRVDGPRLSPLALRALALAHLNTP